MITTPTASAAAIVPHDERLMTPTTTSTAVGGLPLTSFRERAGRRRSSGNGRLRPMNIKRRRNIRNDKLMLSIALYALHLAFDAKLISLIQAKYPQDSPFEKQPKLMIISLVVTAFYGSVTAFQLMVALLPKYTRLYDRLYLVYIIPISGFLSSVSFLLVLVSDKGGWLVLLALLISIATATYYSFKYIHQLIYKRFCDAILQAIDMFNQSFTEFMGFTSVEQQHSTGTTTSV